MSGTCRVQNCAYNIYERTTGYCLEHERQRLRGALWAVESLITMSRPDLDAAAQSIADHVDNAVVESFLDTARLDWLQKHKSFQVAPRNTHVKRAAASVEMSYLPEHGILKRVRGETVREVIDKAMAQEKKPCQHRNRTMAGGCPECGDPSF